MSGPLREAAQRQTQGDGSTRCERASPHPRKPDSRSKISCHANRPADSTTRVPATPFDRKKLYLYVLPVLFDEQI